MPRFRDIPQFITGGSYVVNVQWVYMEDFIRTASDGIILQMNPDFQRIHVWTERQQIAFIEFCLRGGKSGRDIYWNCPGWQRYGPSGRNGPLVLVDGKQRIQAVRRFLANEIPAFGHRFSEYEDTPDMFMAQLIFHVNDLDSRAEVLQWYLEMNAGGTPHTDEEIERVRRLLEQEDK